MNPAEDDSAVGIGRVVTQEVHGGLAGRRSGGLPDIGGGRIPTIEGIGNALAVHNRERDLPSLGVLHSDERSLVSTVTRPWNLASSV
jgi:hypothetical protein